MPYETEWSEPEHLEANLRDLPLNAKLDAESTSGELAKCTRDDPERNEHSDDAKANTKKG